MDTNEDNIEEILKIWQKKYPRLHCPVCGEGIIEEGVVTDMFCDVKAQTISCVKCWCPLSPLWAFPSIYEESK